MRRTRAQAGPRLRAAPMKADFQCLRSRDTDCHPAGVRSGFGRADAMKRAGERRIAGSANLGSPGAASFMHRFACGYFTGPQCGLPGRRRAQV